MYNSKFYVNLVQQKTVPLPLLLTYLKKPRGKQKPEEKSWSVLEWVEHLNRYGNFYLPEIRKSIDTSQSNPEPDFKPGLLSEFLENIFLKPVKQFFLKKVFGTCSTNKAKKSFPIYF